MDHSATCRTQPMQNVFRWDHADLSLHYNRTHELFIDIANEINLFTEELEFERTFLQNMNAYSELRNKLICENIELLYNKCAKALHQAAIDTYLERRKTF